MTVKVLYDFNIISKQSLKKYNMCIYEIKYCMLDVMDFKKYMVI